MMKKFLWISFDLGIQGDYEGLYTWLDEKSARECGDNLACLNYEYEGDLLQDLKEDIQEAVDINKKTRIYVIYLDHGTKKMKGKFLYGKRKSPLWTGFSPSEAQEEDDG